MIATVELESLVAGVASTLPVESPERGYPKFPELDDIARFYYRAARQGVLLIQSCPACGHVQHYPRHLCVKCGGDPEWLPATGRGRIHTFSIVRVSGFEWFKEQLPYIVAMVELDEGPRMMTNVSECALDEVRIGMPVEAFVVEAGDELGIPLWRPVKSD